VNRIERENGDGYRVLVAQSPVEHVWRGGPLATPPAMGEGKVLASLVQITDLHVLDASSPARAEHTQLLAKDPKWRIMLPMHRPYELLTNHALAMMVESIRRNPVAPVTGTPFDIALVTGDCIDNAQRNELDAYLSILCGGVVSMPYDGVQSVVAGETAFWCPERGVEDDWKRTYGYPSVEGLLSALNSDLICRGIGLPWLPVIGNHDLMRQGTGFTSQNCERWAVGDQKATGMPPMFDPSDALAAYLDDPARYNDGAPTRIIRSDPDRRAVTRDEWIRVHRTRGVGFPNTGSSNGADYIHDLEFVRVIVLDTNHPHGHYEGSLGISQLAWLDDRIRETDKWVVLATHHGLESLTNTTPSSDATNEAMSDEERVLAAAVADVLHRHDRVLAWLSGHRHYHRVVHQPHPEARNAGFWEITTASIIDWPSQARAVEIVQHSVGSIVIICTPIDHDGDLVPGSEAAGSLAGIAGLHRELAGNLVGPGAPARLARLSGSAEHQACVLGVRPSLR
jgi:metallophosphoesterase (TIGR03767 family)